jgi:hypothetical protein
MANYSEFQAANSQRQDEPASNDGGQLDTAGQAILKLLHKAADTAEANSRQASETAQTLSQQLREAENRITELEAKLRLSRERAERAEEWLTKISTEIEDRLIDEPAVKRRQTSRRP